jgi:hypothetical protein
MLYNLRLLAPVATPCEEPKVPLPKEEANS